ncbi:UNVERIFIED_CONTAM: hypothetical protein FKN15_001974 [Acipenser sinensis]
MASDELASKLTRRLKIEEGAEEPVSLTGTQDGVGGRSEEDKPATANADSELGAKLLRRTDINDGVAEHQQPSKKVFNPYTEFKEFSRKQIKDMEKMFKHCSCESVSLLVEYPFAAAHVRECLYDSGGRRRTHAVLRSMCRQADRLFSHCGLTMQPPKSYIAMMTTRLQLLMQTVQQQTAGSQCSSQCRYGITVVRSEKASLLINPLVSQCLHVL